MKIEPFHNFNEVEGRGAGAEAERISFAVHRSFASTTAGGQARGVIYSEISLLL